jgi:hypothetical protein
VVPALWFGGDYLGSGNPFTGGRLAQMSREAQLLRRGALPPSLDVLQRASQTVLLPLLACVPVGLARGGRSRDPILLPLALGGLVWLGEVAVLAALGYAGVTRFLFPAAAALAVVGAAGVVWLMRHARVTPSVRAALVLVLVAQAAPSATRVGDLGGQGARVEARADLEQSLGRLLARVGRHALGAAPRLSSEGVVLTPLAWHAAVLPRSLRGWGIPGLRFAMRDKRWRPFWRAVHHRRRRFRARTIAHDGRLFVISIERQRLPSAAHRPLATRANDPDRAARRSRRDREPVAGRVPHALSDVVRGRGAAGRARSETAALEPRH